MPPDPSKHFFADRPVDTPEIAVAGIGIRERMRPSCVDRPHGRPDWLFMLFYDAVRVGTSPQAPRCQPLTLMVWPPGTYQYYGRRRGRWTHSWIHCEGRFIPRIVRTLGLPIAQPIAGVDPSMTERCLLALLEELTGAAPADPTIVRNLIENWLRRLRREIDAADQPPAVPDRFLDAQRYLQARYDQPLRLEDLADQLAMSVPHACSQFKRYFGVSPMQYVIRLRLHHAEYLLADRNLSIAQIARQVGYDDAYHFSKLFKKHMGDSPTAVRDRQSPKRAAL